MGIRGCVVVVLKNQIVLIFANFDRSPQVSGFKSTFKNQSCVVLIFLLIVSLQLTVVAIDFRNLSIEGGTLPRWSIRIILSMIYRVFLRRQFNKIIFINIGRIISLSFLCWKVYAVKDYLFSLRSIVEKFFLLLPSEFVTHGGVELVDRLKVFASFLESRSVPKEWLLDACARQFYRLLSHLIVYVLFVVNQTFKIVLVLLILIRQIIPTLSIVWKVTVVLCKLGSFLF